MIPSEIKFETGFGKSGDEYGDIQASGDIRNIITALCLYFKTCNANGFIDSHLGSTILLTDYDYLKITYGQFGGKENYGYLGLVFDGSGNWHSFINEKGYSQSIERFLSLETKHGILAILKGALGDDCVRDKWNNIIASPSMSVVVKVKVNWKEVKGKEFKTETTKMVEMLNVLAQSINAISK